jgi:hypothetical protein
MVCKIIRFCVQVKNKPCKRCTSYMRLISWIHPRGSETPLSARDEASMDAAHQEEKTSVILDGSGSWLRQSVSDGRDNFCRH